ncbi:MAG: hypothetical protein GY950_29940 [bacterium]|nr:hypothetical protein [bacterium]
MKIKKIVQIWAVPLSVMLFVQLSVTAFAMQDKPAPEDIRSYEYTLSPPKNDLPGRYTRKEIESFLAASAFGFITRDDVYQGTKPTVLLIKYKNTKKYMTVPWYITKYKELTAKKRKEILNLEINKWFEKKVTVVCKGNPTPEDLETVTYFFNEVNGIIGEEKFVREDGADAGNIVIEFSGTAPPGNVETYIGESACLEDNLRVIFYPVSNRMVIDTYKAGSGLLVSRSQLITFTPAEMAYRKKHRLIKISITNIVNPIIRRLVVFHELSHAVGLSGHSPYPGSNVFPLPTPVRFIKDKREGEVVVRNDRTAFSGLARRMVEILYRPEILPGMTIKEAGEVLTPIKHLDITPIVEITAYLEKRKKVLEEQKKTLLDRAKVNFDRRNAIHRLLTELEDEKEKITKEVKKENKLDKEATKNKNEAEIIRLNGNRVETLLRALEAGAAALEGKQGSTRKLKALKKKIMLRKEDLEIYDQIVNDIETNKKRVAQLEAEEKNINKEEDDMTTTLRRIVRQLKTIEAEIKRFR